MSPVRIHGANCDLSRLWCPYDAHGNPYFLISMFFDFGWKFHFGSLKHDSSLEIRETPQYVKREFAALPVTLAAYGAHGMPKEIPISLFSYFHVFWFLAGNPSLGGPNIT